MMGEERSSVSEIKHAQTKKKLNNHEERITQNERFRLRMQGALTLIGFIIGGGAATTLFLWITGAL